MAIDPLTLDFGSDKRFYVYLYRDPRRGKYNQPLYVGKGTARRRADIHWKRAAENEVLRRILDKIKADGLQPLVEIVAWFDVEDDAFALEKALIARFGRLSEKTGTLANLTGGGEGLSGMRLSVETRAKIGAANRGRAQTPEAIAKIRATLKAKPPRSEGWRANLSAALTGKKKSPEHRAKIVAMITGRKPSAAAREKMRKARLGKPGRSAPPEVLARWSEERRGKPGRPHTAEARAKISAGNKGKVRTPEMIAKMKVAGRSRPPASEETRRKIAAAGRGRKFTAKTIERLRELNIGRKHSEETRAKMKAAWVIRRKRLMGDEEIVAMPITTISE